ncbi:MAG: hypothetical protein ACREB5_10385, partial [Sphingomonadaceae bacterium]
RIAFEAKGSRGTGCFSNFRIISGTGEVVWSLDAGAYLPPPCDNKLPVIYGAVPTGMHERVKATPLRAGVLYRIEAWDGDTYSGAFRFRQSIVIENIDERR